MKCIVLLSAVMACVTAAAAAAASCAASEAFFARHNISADDNRETGSICTGHCCGRGREHSLQSALRRRVDGRAAAATRPISDLLISTRRSLIDHLTGLAYQSRDKIEVLFGKVYREHAARTHLPLKALIDDITYLFPPDPDREDFGSSPPKDLTMSVKKFFQDVFPVAYHNLLKKDNKQFQPEYDTCLKDAYHVVQPFGDIPQQLGSSLSKSLEAARALIQVLGLGAKTLASTEEIIMSANNSVCTNSWMKALGCPKCRGHTAKPCKNYCLNIARGCIGSIISELDAPWSGYVEAVERLNREDADANLRALDTKVSEAIVHAIENHVILEQKVRQECGAPSMIESPQVSHHHSSPPGRRESFRATPPDAEFLQFAASLAATKRLFTNIADRICDEDDLAHETNNNCWTGDVIGEYSKTLVASSSLNDQKYNPEVSSLSQDPRLAALGDRLRQARQLLQSHTMFGNGHLSSESFMQGDEAEEGSGSGRNYDDDAAYDNEGSGYGEGSGDGIKPRIYSGNEITDSSSTTGHATLISSSVLLLSTAVLTLLTNYYT